MMPAQRIRKHLCGIAQTGQPITYQALASALALSPPNTIRQVTDALEHLIAEDAAAGHPLIAALVISKSGSRHPRDGFFDCAKQAGLLPHDASAAQASAFHDAELARAAAFWAERGAPAL